MKFILTFIILILYINNLFSQNVVLNPGFEEYSHLLKSSDFNITQNIDSEFICTNWRKIVGTTPDYYNVNNTDDFFKIPNNIFGNHPSVSGSAYVGACILNFAGAIEPIIGEFSNALVAGKRYKLSFMYRFAGQPCFFYLDKIEVNISNNINSFKKVFLLPTYNDIITKELKGNVEFGDKIINDGLWHEHVGFFLASGDEKYISIGIFYQNDEFFKIIQKYIQNNLLFEQSSIKEQRFYKKYEKLFIHPNPNYKQANNIRQKLAYYFFDNISIEE